MRIQHAKSPDVRDLTDGRPAVEHDEGTALDISAGDSIGQAERADAVRHRHGAQAVYFRVAVGGIAGLEVAAVHHGLDVVAWRRIEQRKAVERRHAEENFDTELLEPPGDI